MPWITLICGILSVLGFISGKFVAKAIPGALHSLSICALISSLSWNISNTFFRGCYEEEGSLTYPSGEHVWQARIVGIREIRGRPWLETQIEAIDGKAIPAFGNPMGLLVIISPQSEVLVRNERILASGVCEFIESPILKSMADWKKFYSYRGISHKLEAAEGKFKIVADSSFNLYRMAALWQGEVQALFEGMMEEKVTWDVVTAMLLGVRTGMEREVMDSFSRTGVMHVLSVSGLHVGILYIILKSFFSLIMRRKRLPLICIIILLIVIWLYALVTGLSPSILRSAFMFSIILAGDALKRRTNTFNSLFCSAFFLLCADPGRIFDIGFQLSYSAMMGILGIYPIISRLWMPTSAIVSWIWSLISVSIAAQLATLPASLFYFHTFPTYFLISNLIAVPATGFIIGLAMAAAILACLATKSIITVFIFSALEWVTGSLLYCLDVISSWPLASLNWPIKAQGLIVTSLIVITLSFWLSHGRKSFFWFSVCLIILSGMLNIQSQIEEKSRSESYILSSGGGIYLGWLSEGQHRLVYAGGGREDEIRMDYLRAFWSAEGFGEAHVEDLSNRIFSRSMFFTDGRDYTWLIIRNGRLNSESLPPGIEIDGIIFQGDAELETVVKVLDYSKSEVFLSGMRPWKEGKVKALCAENGRKFRLIRYIDYIRSGINQP